VNPLPDFLLKHRPETPVFICWMEERGASPKCASPKDASSKKVRVLHAIEVGGAQSKVVEKFNKWLEERICENPNLWYSFTHRRFYSQSPEIYGG
jgi:KDO2-lipid IV(A) lauroyltransferase